MIAPKYRVRNLNFEEKKIFKTSENFLKTSKNVIPRKLQGYEQSYLTARFAILDSILNASNYKVRKFKFSKLFFVMSFLKIFEQNSSYLVH